MSKPEELRLPSYGGQALIEGVLMRGKSHIVAAFRKPSGEIHTEEEQLGGIYISKWSKLPFLRGLVILWDSLTLGMKYLTISANVQAEEEDEQIEGPALYLTLALSIAFSTILFFILPSLISSLLNKFLALSNLMINISEGIIRLLILILYLAIIGKTEDIERVFAYHGAEHKTINAYESGVKINVKNVQNHSMAHARCGTSFLLTLVILSILFFSLFGPMNLVQRIITRLLMIPVLAMISYEVIRWMGNNDDNLFVRILTQPNLLIQNLTTREPDDSMVEIAIAAFDKLLTLEEGK